MSTNGVRRQVAGDAMRRPRSVERFVQLLKNALIARQLPLKPLPGSLDYSIDNPLFVRV